MLKLIGNIGAFFGYCFLAFIMGWIVLDIIKGFIADVSSRYKARKTRKGSSTKVGKTNVLHAKETPGNAIANYKPLCENERMALSALVVMGLRDAAITESELIYDAMLNGAIVDFLRCGLDDDSGFDGGLCYG